MVDTGPRQRTFGWYGVRIGVGLAVLLGIAASAMGARLYPWLDAPDEPRDVIEARWAKVEALAEPPSGDGGDDATLLDAFAAFDGWQPPPGDMPELERDQLNDEQLGAVDAFVAWMRAGASYIAPSCGGPPSPRDHAAVGSLNLGQAALSTAHDSSGLSQVEAVLALAQRERRGGRLVDVEVGAVLAERAALWSKARGVPFPASFARYAPETSEIPRALARDAACVVAMLHGARGYELDNGQLGLPPGKGPPFGLVDMGRETLVFEQMQGRAIEAAANTSDPEAMARAFQDARARAPKSVLIDTESFDASFIRGMGEKIAHYHALVK